LQNNLIKPGPECQTILDFVATRDDGDDAVVTTGCRKRETYANSSQIIATNHHTSSQAGYHSCRPTNNVKLHLSY